MSGGHLDQGKWGGGGSKGFERIFLLTGAAEEQLLCRVVTTHDVKGGRGRSTKPKRQSYLHDRFTSNRQRGDEE